MTVLLVEWDAVADVFRISLQRGVTLFVISLFLRLTFTVSGRGKFE